MLIVTVGVIGPLSLERQCICICLLFKESGGYYINVRNRSNADLGASIWKRGSKVEEVQRRRAFDELPEATWLRYWHGAPFVRLE